jgi:hypothetical protein
VVSVEVVKIERRLRDLERSVDISIGQLLHQGTDPFALASYYWCLCKHQVQLVNSTWLSQWADAWVTRVLIEGQVGIRFDEEIAVASLIVSARRFCNVGTRDEAGVIQGRLLEVLSASKSSTQVPLGNQAYGSCLLLAALEFSKGAHSSILPAALESTKAAFEASMPSGRMIGLVYLTSAIAIYGESQLCMPSLDLDEAWQSNRSSFENQVYILQAYINQTTGRALNLESIEELLERLPIWQYLMVGTEEVDPMGHGDSGVVMSHLFRAALLDVLIIFEARVREALCAERKLKNRGRVLPALATALGVFVLLSVPWIILALVIGPDFDSGRLYWMQSEYSAMEDGNALLFMASCIAVVFVACWEWYWIRKVHGLVTNGASMNDKQIASALKASARRAGLSTIAVIVVVLPSFFASELKHAVTGLLN